MVYDRCSSITLRQLQIFSTVSRERSFARAAESLCLSQPAVSAQIKQLETILGVRLLARSRGRRSISLTAAGEILLASCEDIARTLERTDRALSAFRSLKQGSVAFGASLYFGAYILPRVHTAFRQHHPGIEVTYEIGDVPDVLDGLRRQRFDLVVVAGPVDDAALVAEPLGSYEVVLVGRPGHRLQHGPPAPFVELRAEQLLLPKPTFVLHSIMQHRAAQEGITLQVAMETNHIEAKVRAVADGVGIAPIGSLAAVPGITAGQLTILQVEGFPIRIDYAVVHQKGNLSSAADLYRRHLLAYHASEVSAAK
ncbi:MAG TPA: LysR family transcriptional regulator [Chloroflexota bacterium]|nr:LysR family transcriptional regulator [Chloroflexota bacterium]